MIEIEVSTAWPRMSTFRHSEAPRPSRLTYPSVPRIGPYATLTYSPTENGQTVLIITHNQAICPMADRVVKVRSGSVSEVVVNPTPTPVEEIEW